jgi:hypothetical protein
MVDEEAGREDLRKVVVSCQSYDDAIGVGLVFGQVTRAQKVSLSHAYRARAVAKV